MKQTVKIATRSSQLALWQAEWVKSQLICLFPETQVGTGSYQNHRRQDSGFTLG